MTKNQPNLRRDTMTKNHDDEEFLSSTTIQHLLNKQHVVLQIVGRLDTCCQRRWSTWNQHNYVLIAQAGLSVSSMEDNFISMSNEFKLIVDAFELPESLKGTTI